MDYSKVISIPQRAKPWRGHLWGVSGPRSVQEQISWADIWLVLGMNLTWYTLVLKT